LESPDAAVPFLALLLNRADIKGNHVFRLTPKLGSGLA
jgi:hypothetical protein